MESRHMVVNKQLLHYYHAPHGSAATLIFLHGWRSDSTAWFPMLQELQKIGPHELLCLDLPGFGRSELPKKDFTLDDYAGIVREFIKKMNLGNPIIIGHSFGGRIAIKMAAKYAKEYRHIILIDSAGIKPRERKIISRTAQLVKPLFGPHWMQQLRKKIYGYLGAEDYVATPQLQKTYQNIIGEDLTPLLSEIQTDTLLIWGEKDTDTPLADGKMMQRSIAHSALTVIKNSGHFPFVEQPNLVAQKIHSFIQPS